MSVIHFALAGHTACGQHIHGNQTRITDENLKHQWDHDYNGGPNVQHVCIPSLVTCKVCLKTQQFKDYLKKNGDLWN